MDAGFEKLLNDLKKGNYAPIYFFQGDEPFYLNELSDHIEEHCLNEQDKGFNQTILYGKDADMGKILSSARGFPMMAERRLLMIKEAQDIRDFNKESTNALFEAYLENPANTTVLVFVYRNKLLAKNTRLYKRLDKNAVVYNAKKIYDNQVSGWIKEYISSKGLTMSVKGVQILADYIGNNLERLANEINKIKINLSSGEEIGEEHIQKFVGINKDYNVFELQNALGKKDVLKANKIVNYFGENPKANPVIPVIAILFTFFSKLLLIHHSNDRSERVLAGVLKVNPFFVKDYVLASRYYPLSKVIQNIHAIKEADLIVKGVKPGGHGEGQVLKELVYKLLH